jgi:methylated-DNA-protein-cysteine methyltransferase-like protein
LSHLIKNMSINQTSYDRIYEIVRLIPKGQVATYGQIAELANLAGKARVVGYALYRVDLQDLDIPWQRVVNAKGKVSLSPLRFGTDYLQRSLLESEGIIFNGTDQIDLRKYLWKPSLPIICQSFANQIRAKLNILSEDY